MKRGAYQSRGGPVEARVAALEEFSRQLSQLPLLEAALVYGTLPAGETTTLVRHGLGRTPLGAFIGSLSTVAALVPLDGPATRAIGGDPSREIAVGTAAPIGTAVTFALLLL